MLRVFFLHRHHKLIKIIHKNFIGSSTFIKKAYKLYFIYWDSGCTREIMCKILDFMNCRLSAFGIGIMSQWIGTKNGKSEKAGIITQIRPHLW